MLYNRIKQQKGEMHKSQNTAQRDSLWTEIETLQWVLEEFYYQKTTGEIGRAILLLGRNTSDSSCGINARNNK